MATCLEPRVPGGREARTSAQTQVAVVSGLLPVPPRPEPHATGAADLHRIHECEVQSASVTTGSQGPWGRPRTKGQRTRLALS